MVQLVKENNKIFDQMRVCMMQLHIILVLGSLTTQLHPVSFHLSFDLQGEPQKTGPN